jgi:hypothetical protein
MKSKRMRSKISGGTDAAADQHERVVIYMPRALHRQLKDKLAAQGTSVSGWMRRLANEEVQRKH